jgi:steroid delta-isomerase-like uncharacterized protein
MIDERNAALARRWFDEVWNQRRDDTVHELLHPEAIGHLEGLVTHGIEKFFEARSYITGAFPDLELTLDDLIAKDDNVVVRWSLEGTHRGENLGIPPTGERVRFRGMTWLRFRNGQIVEGWDSWNQGRVVGELRAAAQKSAATSGTRT